MAKVDGESCANNVLICDKAHTVNGWQLKLQICAAAFINFLKHFINKMKICKLQNLQFWQKDRFTNLEYVGTSVDHWWSNTI